MLSEPFLDSCIGLCCSDADKLERQGALFDSILFIFKWSKKESTKDDLPTEFKNKIDLAQYLAKYRVTHKKFSFEKLTDAISEGRFKDYIDLLQVKREKFSESDDIDEKEKTIFSKRRFCESLTGKKGMEKFLIKVDSGEFDDEDDLIQEWEDIVDNAALRVNQLRRYEAMDKITELELAIDDYGAIMNDIRQNHEEVNIIPSGFESFDELFCGRGFEPRRLYLFAGTSSVGKSTMLSNLLYNAIMNKKGGDDYYLYMVGENLISETLERFYCIFTGTPYSKLVKKIKSDPSFSLGTEMKKILGNRSANVGLVYFKPRVTTLTDLRSIIDTAAQNKNLKAVYIDYLDLVNSGFRDLEIRLDQAEVSLGFKDFAVEYNIPILTATQLNRMGYNRELGTTLSSMGESMKKVDYADSVLFMQEAEPNKFTKMVNGKKCVFARIKSSSLKNRNARKNVSTTMLLQETENGKDVFNFKFKEASKVKAPASTGFIVGDNDAKTFSTF